MEARRGCTQGDINSPIIFNVIVDAVIRTWKKSGDFKESKSCFYADDGLLESMNPEDLQQDLDKIIELFGRVGLKANELKTKYMIVRGAAAPKAMSTENYNNITRVAKTGLQSGMKHNEWRKMMTECTICGKQMQNASLKRHMQTQHPKNTSEETSKYECQPTNTIGKTYHVRSFVRGKDNPCPVPGCTGGGKDKHGMYQHFCFRHPKDDIVIQEDGVLPKCELCGMRTSNLEKHRNTPTCKKAQTRRTNEVKQEQQAKAEKVSFTVNGKPIKRVREFLYLGRLFTDNDDDTPCIKRSLKKARQRWNCIAKILKAEGTNAKTMSKFYMTVVQAVLLYGADTWVIKKSDMDSLRSFHKRAMRYMTGRHIRKKEGGEWEYPDSEEIRQECGLLDIEVYIQRRRGTLKQYFDKFRPRLLVEAQKCPRHCKDANKVVWWEQAVLYNTNKKKWKKKGDQTNTSVDKQYLVRTS